MAQIYPPKAKEIARLRSEFKQYQDIANRTTVGAEQQDTNIDARR